MKQEIVQVDAFTSRVFAGNPAAVCVMEGAANETWMQLVAREMNLSETAFLYPIEGGYHLRWFTPMVEVDLCGHGTLSAAHVLFEAGLIPADETIRFETRSGWVLAKKDGDWIELDFPVNPLKEVAVPEGLVEALGVKPVYVGEYPKAFLVELASDRSVRELKPNLTLLSGLGQPKVCVTAIDSTGQADIVSRLFAPGIGIAEDPVNGNSHTVLAGYWSPRLGKTELMSYYASARGGMVRIRLQGDRVKIGGQAVTVMRGQIVWE